MPKHARMSDMDGHPAICLLLPFYLSLPSPPFRDTPLCDDATAAVCTNNSIADAPQRIEAGPQHRKFVASSCKKLESLLEEGDRGGAISASR